MVLPAPYELDVIDDALLVATPGAMEVARRSLRESDSLFAFAAGHPSAEPLCGRGTLYSIAVGRERWVVRHYRRGGAVAPWLGDRYVRVGVPRPVHELRVSCALRRRGVDTPRVVASVVYPAGAFYRADLATVQVRKSTDLAEALFGETELEATARLTAWKAVGRLIAVLHERGVIHTDLNLKNIVLDWSMEPPRPYVIDLDRCRVVDRVPGWRRAAMLRRFHRSREKWEAQTGRAVPREELNAFDEAYRSAGG